MDLRTSEGGFSESGVTSAIYSNFKGAVGTLVEPCKISSQVQKEVNTSISSRGFSPMLQGGNTVGASVEYSESSATFATNQVGQRLTVDGHDCCSCNSSAKGNNSSQNGHVCMCSKMMQLLAIHSTDELKATEDAIVRLDSEFNKLVWIHKYLKCNILKTKEERMNIISGLCEGLKKIINLSEFNFTDGQFTQFFHLFETLFQIVQYYGEGSKEIHNNVKVKDLFDNILTQMGNEKKDAGSQLLSYPTVSGVMSLISGNQLRELLIWRIFQHLGATVMRVCKQYCRTDSNGISGMLKSKDVNLLFLYCQLLESTVVNINCEPTRWMKNSTLDALLNLEKTAGPLFAIFPNLNYMFQPTIAAVRQHTEQKECINVRFADQ